MTRRMEQSAGLRLKIAVAILFIFGVIVPVARALWAGVVELVKYVG